MGPLRLLHSIEGRLGLHICGQMLVVQGLTSDWRHIVGMHPMYNRSPLISVSISSCHWILQQLLHSSKRFLVIVLEVGQISTNKRQYR